MCPRSLVVHGFTVSEKGEKMSKSVGNVVDPDTVINGGQVRGPGSGPGSGHTRSRCGVNQFWFSWVLHRTCRRTGQTSCVGGLQSPTSSLRSRSVPVPSTQPERTSAKYRRRTESSLAFFFFIFLKFFFFFFLQLRNTLRFLLGNLHRFDPPSQAVDSKDMYYIDQYMLHQLRDYSMKVRTRT